MNDTLLYSLAVLGTGLAGVLIRYSFKSKCSDVGLCCGLINIKRDIEAEVEAERNELELGEKENSGQI